MQKRHAPSEVAHLSKCGYEVTPAEYAAMKKRVLEIMAEQRGMTKE